MIKFGKGIYPRSVCLEEGLVELVNLNWNNEEEIERFCEKYSLLIIPINSSYSKEIEKIFGPLKKIINHYFKENDLLPEHIQVINEHLKDISFCLDKISPTDIRSINYLLDPSIESYDSQIEKLKEPQFGFITKYSKPETPFWKEFAKLISRNRKVKNCVSCGRYFIPKEKSHDQKYCSTECQERYKKKRKYHRTN